LLWPAPSGSGRTLAGRWLEARGVAALVRASRATHARALSPARGALFVELDGASALDDFGALEALAEARPVCVAFAPSTTAPPPGWRVLETARPESYARELVEWIALRLPRDGRFEAEAALAWLERGPLAEGAVDGFGTLLGLCGLVDEVGARALRGRSLAESTRSFVAERLSRAATKGSASAAWLKRAGFELLVLLARRLLVYDDAELSAARSFASWLEAVPAEHSRGPDVEWLRVALAQGGEGRAALRPVDVERAARRVPPGAFRVVRGLEAAGLLRARSEDTLALAPRFLAAVLRREALRDLLAGSALEWGEALLRPRIAVDVAAALEERIMREEGAVIDEVLDLEGDAGPELAAAVEGCFRSAGSILLSGGELGSDSVEGIWDESLGYVIDLPSGLPRPRIGHPEALARASWLLSDGSFYLGALALSERLADTTSKAHDLLRPWTRTQPLPELAAVFDRIASDLALAPPLVQSSAFALVDRLRRTIGPTDAPPHVLEQPGMVLDEIQHDVLAWASIVGLERHALCVPALLALAEGRSIGRKRVARAVWQAWDAAGAPEIALLACGAESDVRFRSAVGSLLAAAPPRLFLRLLERAGALELVAWTELESELWRALLELAFSGLALPEAAWSTLPEAVAVEALAVARRVDGATAFALWRRFPERIAQRLADAAAQRDELAFTDLLRAAPLASTPEVVRALETVLQGRALLELPEGALNELRGQLQERVAKRAPGLQAAYAVLDRIEGALAPVRRARTSRPSP
jgi:hypothetical protein